MPYYPNDNTNGNFHVGPGGTGGTDYLPSRSKNLDRIRKWAKAAREWDRGPTFGPWAMACGTFAAGLVLGIAIMFSLH